MVGLAGIGFPAVDQKKDWKIRKEKKEKERTGKKKGISKG